MKEKQSLTYSFHPVVWDKEKKFIQGVLSDYGHIWLLFSKGKMEIKNETIKSDEEIHTFINEHLRAKVEKLKKISLEIAYLECMTEALPVHIKEKNERKCVFTFHSFETIFSYENEHFYIDLENQLLDVSSLFSDVIKEELKKILSTKNQKEIL